jgi:hypothetical protein
MLCMTAGDAAAGDAAPDDVLGRPLVLAHDEVELGLSAAINLEPRRIGRPLSLSPDAWWGVSPRWTIGLIHSNASVDQIDAGASLCLRDSDNRDCRFYRGSGLDLRVSALAGQFAIAPRVRLLVRDLDPFKPAMTLGAMLRWNRGRFAILSDPYVRLPLANHSLGNRAQLMFPVWFAVQPAAGWALALRTGYAADFVVFGDGEYSALSLGVTARAGRVVDLGVEAGWSSLLGPQHDAKHATAIITLDWRRSADCASLRPRDPAYSRDANRN